MKCQFCHQDIENPCHTMQDMEQRAESHIERCEHALHDQQDSQQNGG